MLKFFKNLLFPKNKKSEPKVEVDIIDGKIKITSDKPLKESEILKIAKEKMKELLERGEL